MAVLFLVPVRSINMSLLQTLLPVPGLQYISLQHRSIRVFFFSSLLIDYPIGNRLQFSVATLLKVNFIQLFGKKMLPRQETREIRVWMERLKSKVKIARLAEACSLTCKGFLFMHCVALNYIGRIQKLVQRYRMLHFNMFKL